MELLTRVTTQVLRFDEGTEEEALSSIHSLFKTTREILKAHGRKCIGFSKVAVVVLNQVIRPFTSKWHRIFKSGDITDEQRAVFRQELADLRPKLESYAHILATIADVEDITNLESTERNGAGD